MSILEQVVVYTISRKRDIYIYKTYKHILPVVHFVPVTIVQNQEELSI